jgi:hypothetical protein
MFDLMIWKGFTMNSLLVLIAMASAADSIPDGKRLKQGETCYTIRARKGGADEVIGTVFQRVSRTRVRGIDALNIVVHQRLANGKFDMRDEFLVRRADLRPLMLNNFRNGKPHVHLDYTERSVTGWKLEQTKEPINVALAQPVWDGNLWGLTFAAMPLRAGSRFRLPLYQYDSGLGSFDVAVKGREKIAAAGKQILSWVLDAGTGPDRRVEYLVTAHGEEVGYRAGPMSQLMGGDCRDLRRVQTL